METIVARKRNLFTWLSEGIVKCLAIMFLLMSGIAYLQAQPESPDLISVNDGASKEPFRKANTLIIDTTNTDEINYADFGSFLVRKGFAIEKANKDFLTMKTGKAIIQKNNTAYALHVAFIQSKIRINIEWTYIENPYGATSYKWFYTPSKSNVRHKIWEDLMTRLDGYPGEIFYQ